MHGATIKIFSVYIHVLVELAWWWSLYEVETSNETINRSQGVCWVWLEISIQVIKILRSAHTMYLCVLYGAQNKAIIFLYSINWLVFITETECVYCAVRTGSLYIIRVMCFVWIWEQTAIISLYSINWLVFITETESVYCAVRIGSLYIIQVMCFVWIWEQTAIISLYSIYWLVFITETESVYCAVRTGSVCIINLNFCLQALIFTTMKTLNPIIFMNLLLWHLKVMP